jgi:integrase
MKLLSAIATYVQAKRDLGHIFVADDRMLRSFAGKTGDVEIASVTSRMCEAFYGSKGPTDTMPRRKHQCLRCFFQFLVSRDYLPKSPLGLPPPRRKKTFQPYIYTKEEIRKILDAAEVTCLPAGFVTPNVIRAFLLTVYAAGLRSGEAMRLRRKDLDLGERLLTVWDTKFFKSRLVPIGSGLANTLGNYLERVQAPQEGPLFPTRVGDFLSNDCVHDAFRRACRHAGISKPSRDPLDVRIHDLRHSFAVHTMVAWYRKGANVQILLPRLSTYMGHIDIRSTQVYLTMTHELLGEASRRFERYAMTKGEKDDAFKTPARSIPPSLPDRGDASRPKPGPEHAEELQGRLRSTPALHERPAWRFARGPRGRGRHPYGPARLHGLPSETPR